MGIKTLRNIAVAGAAVLTLAGCEARVPEGCSSELVKKDSFVKKTCEQVKQAIDLGVFKTNYHDFQRDVRKESFRRLYKLRKKSEEVNDEEFQSAMDEIHNLTDLCIGLGPLLDLNFDKSLSRFDCSASYEREGKSINDVENDVKMDMIKKRVAAIQ